MLQKKHLQFSETKTGHIKLRGKKTAVSEGVIVVNGLNAQLKYQLLESTLTSNATEGIL